MPSSHMDVISKMILIVMEWVAEKNMRRKLTHKINRYNYLDKLFVKVIYSKNLPKICSYGEKHA